MTYEAKPIKPLYIIQRHGYYNLTGSEEIPSTVIYYKLAPEESYNQSRCHNRANLPKWQGQNLILEL